MRKSSSRDFSCVLHAFRGMPRRSIEMRDARGAGKKIEEEHVVAFDPIIITANKYYVR